MDRESRENHFWNNYIAVLSDCQIKSSLYTWYVRHCENFIRENKDTRLKQHTKKSVSNYLSKLINTNSSEFWQKKQAIEAISLLFKSIHAPLYQEIDWDYWKSSCHDLGKEHDTNYRTTYPLANPKEPSSQPGPVQRETISDEINRLRMAIRRVNHSIRTEKTYTDWVHRFLNFIRFEHTSDIDQAAVLKYLEYLAVVRGVSPKTQSIALNSISFYFRNVLNREIGDISQGFGQV